MKFRLLAVLPVLAVASLGLTACDSKAGVAAVVDGHKISETTLSDYAPNTAKPIPANSDGSTIPAKIYVLQVLAQNEVYPLLLTGAGEHAAESDLAAQKTTVLGGSTDQQFTDQLTALGLSAKFEPVFIRNRELIAVIQKKLGTNQAGLNKGLAQVKDVVSISPRYGSWDTATLSVTNLGKAELPSILSYDGTLPGDVKLPAAQ